MKTYSFIRETAPVILKNTPKEGNVPWCFDIRCVYSTGVTIIHSVAPRHRRKMTETKQQVTGNIAHTNIEPYNENNSTHINNVGPDDGP